VRQSFKKLGQELICYILEKRGKVGRRSKIEEERRTSREMEI